MDDLKDAVFLIVDDDDVYRKRLLEAFIDREFVAHQAASYTTALEAQEKTYPTHAVVDLQMPGKSGLELIPKLLESEPCLQIIVLTGYGSITTATEAIRLGAKEYLSKPADVDEILNVFRRFDPKVQKPNDSHAIVFKPPSLAEMEWDHIQRVLGQFDGNITKAARVLGIHRRSLQRKLQRTV